MRLDFINGLRGWAILAVIYHHVFGPFTRPGHEGFDWGGLTISPYTVLSNGWLGVSLFFVLSGFVLALPYFDGRRRLGGSGDVRWFYWQRAKRLLPLYYFNVVLSMIFLRRITEAEAPIRDLFLMGTVTFNFLDATYMPGYNWVLWSLGIEVWFSVTFPLLILAIDRWGIWKVGFAVLCIAMTTRLVGYDYRYVAGFSELVYLNPVKDSFVGRLDDFFLGIVICHLCVNREPLIRSRSGHFALLLLGVALSLVVMVGWDNVALRQIPKLATPFLHLLLNVAFFCIIYPLYSMAGSFRRVVLESFPVMLAGVMCYSLYVWHGIAVVKLIHRDYSFENLFFYFLMLFILSALSYRYIEFGHVADWRGLFLLKPKPTPPRPDRGEGAR